MLDINQLIDWAMRGTDQNRNDGIRNYLAFLKHRRGESFAVRFRFRPAMVARVACRTASHFRGAATSRLLGGHPSSRIDPRR